MSEIRKRLFGTSGLRGEALREITPELSLKLGLGYGSWLSRNRRKRSKILIGWDPRYSADLTANIISNGLIATGHDVGLLGIVPTGQFAFTVASSNVDGGILVTGSHMPYSRLGIIIFLEDGTYAPFEVTDKVEELMNSETLSPIGSLESIGIHKEVTDLHSKYLNFLYSSIDTGLISKRKFRVLVDPANGSACKVVREILERLQLDISIINHNCKPVPGRSPEPTHESVEEAVNIMKVIGYDLGLCFDTDADRVLFIDESGIVIPPDTIGAIFVLHILQEEDTCVIPVNSSGLISDIASKANFEIEYCKIGQPETIKAIKKHKARFAYEESGKYYFSDIACWSDGILTSLKLLEIMAMENKSLKELVTSIPRYYQLKYSADIPGSQRIMFSSKLDKLLEGKFNVSSVEKIQIDGTKLVFRDGSSLMFRLSGTEPLVRLYCDGPDQEKVKSLFAKGKEIIQSLVK